ncbi:M1 family metallopeptidase [uncultured Eudoraea sp.]|uniref:M1 family metallopeptidase n=1 Tax=uncultured Eudoraea sp. TaxID=1035614 RepID=UPI00261B24A1|nr:M1 family metallopeptidase [uncultured Eudoraea sp.]
MKFTNLLLFILFTGFLFSQPQPSVDFFKADVDIIPDPGYKRLNGKVTYSFKVLKKTDSVFLDAKNMEFSSVLLNGKKVRNTNTKEKLFFYKKLKADKTYKLTLDYSTIPKQTVYFLGWEDSIPNNNQIWTQGQGKYTSHWLPSFDDMNEKVEFDLSLTFDKDYEVIANGKLKDTLLKESLRTWFFDMNKPMSSYLLAFAIGNYKSKRFISKSGIPIELYYYPGDSLKEEPTYRYSGEIFDFLSNEIGIAYPWQNYKQIPVRDFLYSGMENTGTTIFSDGFVIDSVAFVDKNYVNVNAHEMAHQWFGNLVTEKDGNHHWLHEGFATYYALLAEKKLFGDDYFYWKLYESAKQLQKLSNQGKGEALTNPKASSLTFYEKGAWALHILRDKLGDKAFKEGIQAYLNKYQYSNVTISDFISEMELVSEMDLLEFVQVWLKGTQFPFEKVKKLLAASSTDLQTYFDLQWELTSSNTNNEQLIKKLWDNNLSTRIKENIILDYHKSLSESFLKNAFTTKDLKTRQALCITTDRIPSGLKNQFESLLQDKSYITIENALYRLWISYPNDRIAYLERTKGVIGLPNKNVRLLWLFLAVLTKDYLNDVQKAGYTEELFGYTSAKYSFEVRQNAFSLLAEVFPLTDQNLLDLVDASIHHSWQFRNFARNLIEKLLKDDKQKERLLKLSEELNEKELRYIKSKLEVE